VTDSVFKLTQPRIVLLIIIGMFVIPLVLAKFYLDYMNDYGVSATLNKGTLISPAKPLMDIALLDVDRNPLPAKLLKGHWTYVMLADAACDDRCEKQLELTKTTRILVNKDMQRVNRLLVVAYQPSDEFVARIKTDHPQLTLAVLTRPIWTEFTVQFQSAIDNIGGMPFFLVDPNGNLMMGYDDSISPKDILGDLKKLLKASMIG